MHCYFNAVYSGLKQAVNYNDFSFFNFRVVCEDWSKIVFERPECDFKLSTNFEVGLNLDTYQHSPFDVIARYMSYVSTTINEFYTCPPYHLKGKPIERMAFLNDYKIKVYDKSKQAGLKGQNLLRYEIVYTEIRKVRQVLGLGKQDDITLASLMEVDSWNKFFNTLLHVYDRIKKIPLSSQQVVIDEIPLIHGYCNKIMAADLKKSMNINTYNKKRGEMKIVYAKHDVIQNNFHQVIRNELINKFNDLMYNSFRPCNAI